MTRRSSSILTYVVGLYKFRCLGMQLSSRLEFLPCDVTHLPHAFCTRMWAWAILLLVLVHLPNMSLPTRFCLPHSRSHIKRTQLPRCPSTLEVSYILLHFKNLMSSSSLMCGVPRSSHGMELSCHASQLGPPPHYESILGEG